MLWCPNGAEALGVSKTTVRAFLHDTAWVFPKKMSIKSKALYKIFDDSRSSSSAASASRLRCTCSEALGLYGLLRYFIESRIADAGSIPAVASFQKCCSVLDLIMQAKTRIRDPTAVGAELKIATSEFLRLHKVCRSVCLGDRHRLWAGWGRGLAAASVLSSGCGHGSVWCGWSFRHWSTPRQHMAPRI